MTDTSIPAETRIGHVHLKVADLERAIGFYRDYLGFDLLANLETAAFLSCLVAIITTLASTPGRARTARHLRLARLACITSPSTTRHEKISPWRSNACSTKVGRSMGHPIT